METGKCFALFCFAVLESFPIQFGALNELISKPIIEENDHLPSPYVDFIFKYLPLKVLKLIKVVGFTASRIWQAEQRISVKITF